MAYSRKIGKNRNLRKRSRKGGVKGPFDRARSVVVHTGEALQRRLGRTALRAPAFKVVNPDTALRAPAFKVVNPDTTLGFPISEQPAKISQVITIDRKDPSSMKYLNDTEQKNREGETKERIILNKDNIREIKELEKLYPASHTKDIRGTVKPIWLYDFKEEFEPKTDLDHIEFVKDDGKLKKINYYNHRRNHFLKSWAPCTLEIQSAPQDGDIITINGNNIIFNVGSSKFTVNNVNLEEMTTAPTKDKIGEEVFNKGKLGFELLSHILKEAPNNKTPCCSSVHSILKVNFNEQSHLVILVTDHYKDGMGLKLGPGGSVDYPGIIAGTLDKEMLEEMGLIKGEHYNFNSDKIVSSVINIKSDKNNEITPEHPVNVTMQSLRDIELIEQDKIKLEYLFRNCEGVPTPNRTQRETWAYFLVPFNETLKEQISQLNYKEDGTFLGGTFNIENSILISDNYDVFLELATCRGLITDKTMDKDGTYNITFNLLATGSEGNKYTTDTFINNIRFYNSDDQKWAIKSKASDNNLQWHLNLQLHPEFKNGKYLNVYQEWMNKVAALLPPPARLPPPSVSALMAASAATAAVADVATVEAPAAAVAEAVTAEGVTAGGVTAAARGGKKRKSKKVRKTKKKSTKKRKSLKKRRAGKSS